MKLQPTRPVSSTPHGRPRYQHSFLTRALALLTAAATFLSICSAPLAAQTTTATPVDAATLQKLLEENAALRQRLQKYEPVETTTEITTTPAAVSSATTTTTQTATASAAQAQTVSVASSSTTTTPSSTETTTTTNARGEEVVVMSPFAVSSEKDYGYLRTNAATATRIGMEIQRAPVNIAVMSEDFIKDTNLRSITDILRFTASGSPDSRFAMRRPANEATPQGNFTMRGFTVNSLMRDGVFRYVAYNLDNVDRVEIVKGPAAVFFGQGYPGGVINYITKKPIFSKQPSTIAYSINDNGGQKVVADVNEYFSPKAALRVVGAWTDDKGERRFEKFDNFNITPSITLIPFSSGKVRITLDYEHLEQTYNQNDGDWIYPDQYFADYQNPSAALMTAAGVTTVAAYQARIFNSIGNWIADTRKVANDPTMPLYTSIQRGAYYQGANNQRIHDEAFNYTTRGSYGKDIVNTLTGALEVAPFEWLDARYVYTNDNSRYDAVESYMVPNGDGRTFNTVSAAGLPGYYRKTENHQLDMIFKKDFWGMKNKLLLGGNYIKYLQQYDALQEQGLYYGNTPGATNPAANQYVNAAGQTVILVPPQYQNTGAVPVNQVIRDRYGVIKRVDQIYSQWDPGFEIEPDASNVANISRTRTDGYPTKNYSLYANLQIQTLKDRLTIFGGYRYEWQNSYGQTLIANDPWFAPPADAYLHQDIYPPSVYNYDPLYAGDPDNWAKLQGDSWMVGVSFEIVNGITAYATVSKTFKFNTGIAGGYSRLDIRNLLNDALTHGGGSFQYRGQTITSIDQGLAAIAATGANQELENEAGMNYEVGVKTDIWNSKLVATFSLFQGERKNQKLDDAQAQANANEPFNYSTTLFDSTSKFYNLRNFRWRTVGVHNRIQGAEFDLTWTPIRNWQTVLNGAWLFTAETLSNPMYPKGSSAFADMYYRNRIENVPEYRLNLVSKYTLTNGFLRGLSLTGMMRYSSETVIARSFDYNPDRGGLQAGDYIVIDALVGYPWEVFGYKLSSSFGVYNITDKEYMEGSAVVSKGINWTFLTSIAF